MGTFVESIGFLVWLICGVGILSPAQTPSGTARPQSQVIKHFSEAATVIRQKTPVPVRIPTGIPQVDDFYAIVKSADESGYRVILGATPDCEGQHVCSYGTLIGTTRAFDKIDDYGLTDRRGTRVTLLKGLRGYFYDTVCGAYCNDSVIVWTEGKYHYVIGLKAESRANMIKVANSAIRAGTDRWK